MLRMSFINYSETVLRRRKVADLGPVRDGDRTIRFNAAALMSPGFRVAQLQLEDRATVIQMRSKHIAVIRQPNRAGHLDPSYLAADGETIRGQMDRRRGGGQVLVMCDDQLDPGLLGGRTGWEHPQENQDW